MRIGIIGLGVVGSAIKYGFEKLGHHVNFHDIKYDTNIIDVIDTDIIYLCLPTPEGVDGRCDTNLIKLTADSLHDLGYRNPIAIKSTVSPGTTQSLIDRYSNNNICFVPEFLRERCADIDFVENHDVCIIGTENIELFKLIKECHGHLPRAFKRLSPTEAELAKYFNNIYNAVLVTFANSFFEVCSNLGANYTNIKNAIVLRKHIIDMYLDCNKNFRGFGGACLPKDLKEIAELCKSRHIDVEIFDAILSENQKYKTTVFKGMRK